MYSATDLQKAICSSYNFIHKTIPSVTYTKTNMSTTGRVALVVLVTIRNAIVAHCQVGPFQPCGGSNNPESACAANLTCCFLNSFVRGEVETTPVPLAPTLHTARYVHSRQRQLHKACQPRQWMSK